jgi:hypothetical protein
VVNLIALIPGVLATLASAGALALLAAMTPSIRWSRQLAREVSILSGLAEGEERQAWERRVQAHARRLRLYHELIPRWQKIVPWVVLVPFVALVVLVIVDPRQIDAFVQEGPSIIFLILAGLIGVGMYTMTGVLGLDLEGHSGEALAARVEAERRAGEDASAG